MVAFLRRPDASTGDCPASGVQPVARTLTGIGPHRPTEPDLKVAEVAAEVRTQAASSLDLDEGTTPVPDVAVSERPGASPLTVQLRLLDAYLRQVRAAEVPLRLAVGRTRR